MPKAIFVSIRRLYPQLKDTTRDSPTLRNCTCAWWRIDPERAAGVRYVFGVTGGRVVSAYAVDVPVEDWPMMPANAVGAGRRYIPAWPLLPEEWARATAWTSPHMYGAVRYADVHLDDAGKLHDFAVPVGGPVCDDEREPDDGG